MAKANHRLGILCKALAWKLSKVTSVPGWLFCCCFWQIFPWDSESSLKYLRLPVLWHPVLLEVQCSNTTADKRAACTEGLQRKTSAQSRLGGRDMVTTSKQSLGNEAAVQLPWPNQADRADVLTPTAYSSRTLIIFMSHPCETDVGHYLD